MMPLILLPNSLVSGLLVNLDQIPDWFFFKWISPFRYGFESMVRNEFTHLDGYTHHE